MLRQPLLLDRHFAVDCCQLLLSTPNISNICFLRMMAIRPSEILMAEVFRVLQLVTAFNSLRVTCFTRRAFARAFLDVCVTLEGDCIFLDMGRATRIFERMRMGSGALGRNPVQPFDWCPNMHAARELGQLSVIRQPALFERWLKGNLCELRHFTDSGTQLRTPFNWVISICQGRLCEYLEFMRTPTYVMTTARVAEGYPADLSTNENAAQLLAACLLGLKEQAHDVSLREVWLNLHGGKVIPPGDNPAAATAQLPVPAPPVPAARGRAARAALPAVFPGAGHNNRPLGSPPQRLDTLEALRERILALEAGIHDPHRTGRQPPIRGRGRQRRSYWTPRRGARPPAEERGSHAA